MILISQLTNELNKKYQSKSNAYPDQYPNAITILGHRSKRSHDKENGQQVIKRIVTFH